MSKKSSKSKQGKPQQKGNQSYQASKGKPKGKVNQSKERGLVLTIILVIMALHGIVASVLYYYLRVDTAYLSRPWLVSLMVVHSLADVVAVVGVWFWKRWGMYVYAASTVLALVVGLLSVGMWSVFYMILPLVILGWVLRSKWSYFED